MTKRMTASYMPKLPKVDPASIIYPADYVAGDYAKRIEAGELSVTKGTNHIVALELDGEIYKAKTHVGEIIWLNPTDRLVIGPVRKPFVRQAYSPFSKPPPPAGD